MTEGALQIDFIRSALSTKRVGNRVEYVPTTTSTNDAIIALIESEESDGLVLFSETQTSGRGRHGRQWLSPAGASLLCSTLVFDSDGEISGGEIALLTAVALRSAIASSTDVRATIKWPNDIMVSGRKLGGILVESRSCSDGRDAFVIGIGLNCLQQKGHFGDAIANRATSLELESKSRIERSHLAVALLQELDLWLALPKRWNYEQLRGRWIAGSSPLGSRMKVKNRGKHFTGTVIDIDPAAAIVLQLDEGGLRAFNSADTTVLET